MTYFAWTNFSVPNPDNPGNDRLATKINVGDEVSAEALGIDDEEFQAYIDIGAVRTYEHPNMGNFQGSPVELRKAQLAAAAEGGFFDTQYGTVGVDVAPEIDPETGLPIVVEENTTTTNKPQTLAERFGL